MWAHLGRRLLTDFGIGSPNGAAAGSTTERKQSGSGLNGRAQTDRTEASYKFISYVAAEHEEEPDPDGLDHKARMALEEKAIQAILSIEPTLKRTPPGNPGFDLYEAGANGGPVKWIEVKAMTRTLRTRPVGLTQKELETAMERRSAYWLYIVEEAATSGAASLLGSFAFRTRRARHARSPSITAG